MMSLRTGTPGSCKTLSAVQALSKLIARWEKNPEEARPIYVHGIKDLSLPHSPLPLIEWREGNKAPVMVPDWATCEPGAFIVIDEAQTFFPPRSSQSTPPPHVSWLNTHRHFGFDIEFITQHPKLIDGSVRALVGKHQHFRRLFGSKRAYCYEWDACCDNLNGQKTAVGSVFNFPRDAFKWYKSAEVHTKQSFRLPKWLILPFIGIAIGVFALPRAYSVLTGNASSKVEAKEPPKTIPKAAPVASAPIGAVSAPVPVVQAVKEAFVGAPAVSGCVATPARCLCVDAQGKEASIDDDACRVAAVKLGGLVPYDVRARPPAGSSLYAAAGQSAIAAAPASPFSVPPGAPTAARTQPASTQSLILGAGR